MFLASYLRDTSSLAPALTCRFYTGDIFFNHLQWSVFQSSLHIYMLHNMDIKVATLNLCFGIQSKKNQVKETILSEKIDVLCMQETEIMKMTNYQLQ